MCIYLHTHIYISFLHRFECVAVGFFVNAGHSACRKARCHVTLGDLCGSGKKLFDTH